MLQKFTHLKLSHKLILFIALTGISINVIVSWFSLNNAKSELTTSIVSKLATVAQLKTDVVKDYLSKIKSDVSVLKNNSTLLYALSADTVINNNTNALDSLLGACARAKNYQAIKLINHEGVLVYSTKGKPLGVRLGDADDKSFVQGQVGIYCSDLYQQDGVVKMNVSAPLILQNKLIGVLVVETDMNSFFYSLVNGEIGLGETGEIIVAKRIPEGALYLNTLRFDKTAALSRKAIVGDKASKTVLEAVNGNSGEGIGSDYREEEVLAAWRAIPEMQWGVVVKMDASEAFEPLHWLQSMSIIIALILLVVVIVTTYLMTRTITNRLVALNKAVKVLGKGDLLKEDLPKANSDEIGEMIKSTNELAAYQKDVVQFAENVGNGVFDANENSAHFSGALGTALVNMRNSLHNAAKEEEKRSWAIKGQAMFGDILRKNDSTLDELYDDIVSNLTKYVKANQASLFILNDDNKEDKYLELVACYAWERKKFLEAKHIKWGEGLVGRSWQEQDIVYLTDVPNHYVTITSGLGEANPKSILISPLKINDEVFGVVEIASFNDFQTHEIEFVQKLGESIASTISAAKINSRTKKLLQESQEHAEQMRAQEEEIRQNLEEMQATQSEMERAQRAMTEALRRAQEKEEEALNMQHQFEEERNRIQAEFDAQLNIINETAIVSKTDVRGNITYVNDMFCKVAKYTREELMGKPHNIVRHPDMPAEAFADLWKTISGGKVWKGQVKNKAKDGSYYWVQATISPVIGASGKPVEYMAVRYLITAMKDKEEEVHHLVEEMRAQQEELKQNMEEMNAIQSNMSLVQSEMTTQMNIINKTAIVSKTDLRGVITYVNDEFCKWSKYSREELVGKNQNIVRHPDMPAAAFEDLWRTISSGRVWRGQVKNKAKDGSAYWVDATISPVLGESGKPKEYMGVRYIINEEKRLLDENTSLKQELEALKLRLKK